MRRLQKVVSLAENELNQLKDNLSLTHDVVPPSSPEDLRPCNNAELFTKLPCLESMFEQQVTESYTNNSKTLLSEASSEEYLRTISEHTEVELSSEPLVFNVNVIPACKKFGPHCPHFFASKDCNSHCEPEPSICKTPLSFRSNASSKQLLLPVPTSCKASKPIKYVPYKWTPIRNKGKKPKIESGRVKPVNKPAESIPKSPLPKKHPLSISKPSPSKKHTSTTKRPETPKKQMVTTKRPEIPKKQASTTKQPEILKRQLSIIKQPEMLKKQMSTTKQSQHSEMPIVKSDDILTTRPSFTPNSPPKLLHCSKCIPPVENDFATNRVPFCPKCEILKSLKRTEKSFVRPRSAACNTYRSIPCQDKFNPKTSNSCPAKEFRIILKSPKDASNSGCFRSGSKCFEPAIAACNTSRSFSSREKSNINPSKCCPGRSTTTSKNDGCNRCNNKYLEPNKTHSNLLEIAKSTLKNFESLSVTDSCNHLQFNCSKNDAAIKTSKVEVYIADKSINRCQFSAPVQNNKVSSECQCGMIIQELKRHPSLKQVCNPVMSFATSSRSYRDCGISTCNELRDERRKQILQKCKPQTLPGVSIERTLVLEKVLNLDLSAFHCIENENTFYKHYSSAPNKEVKTVSTATLKDTPNCSNCSDSPQEQLPKKCVDFNITVEECGLNTYFWEKTKLCGTDATNQSSRSQQTNVSTLNTASSPIPLPTCDICIQHQPVKKHCTETIITTDIPPNNKLMRPKSQNVVTILDTRDLSSSTASETNTCETNVSNLYVSPVSAKNRKSQEDEICDCVNCGELQVPTYEKPCETCPDIARLQKYSGIKSRESSKSSKPGQSQKEESGKSNKKPNDECPNNCLPAQKSNDGVHEVKTVTRSDISSLNSLENCTNDNCPNLKKTVELEICQADCSHDNDQCSMDDSCFYPETPQKVGCCKAMKKKKNKKKTVSDESKCLTDAYQRSEVECSSPNKWRSQSLQPSSIRTRSGNSAAGNDKSLSMTPKSLPQRGSCPANNSVSYCANRCPQEYGKGCYHVAHCNIKEHLLESSRTFTLDDKHSSVSEELYVLVHDASAQAELIDADDGLKPPVPQTVSVISDCPTYYKNASFDEISFDSRCNSPVETRQVHTVHINPFNGESLIGTTSVALTENKPKNIRSNITTSTSQRPRKLDTHSNNVSYVGSSNLDVNVVPKKNETISKPKYFDWKALRQKRFIKRSSKGKHSTEEEQRSPVSVSSEGEIECKCTLSIGEIHKCEDSTPQSSKIFKSKFSKPDVGLKIAGRHRNFFNKNLVSYYLSASSSLHES